MSIADIIRIMSFPVTRVYLDLAYDMMHSISCKCNSLSSYYDVVDIAQHGTRVSRWCVAMKCPPPLMPSLQLSFLTSQVLLLDSSIRDWVLFPILIVMILVGLVRHNITQLITSTPKMQPSDVVRQQRILARSATLRNNRYLIDPTTFKNRLNWFTDILGNGDYVKKEEEKPKGELDMPKNPLSDPNQMEAMMEQAKKSMVQMIPQTVIMGWINYFFTGFVLSE